MRLLNPLALLLITLPAWSMSLSIQPSTPSPTPIGTTITLRAAVSGSSGGSLWYRYRIRTPDSGEFRMVRDFSPVNSFDWVPTETDGIYELEVSARNVQSGDTTVETLPYVVESRVAGDMPVITPTNNVLVFLYSAPPCDEGSRMRVDFVSEDKFRQFTSWMKCSATTSMNYYLAGLRADTRYRVRHVVEAADGSRHKDLNWN